MALEPLDSNDDSEPELIPHRVRGDNPFSKPFEIRITWLVLIGTGLLVWKLSLNDWSSLRSGSPNSVWWLAVVPLGWVWWKLRRWGRRPNPTSKRPRELFPIEDDKDSDDSESQIRLVDDESEMSPLKMLGGLGVYVLAVLILLSVALWQLLLGC